MKNSNAPIKSNDHIVKLMETKYPEMIKEFQNILDECYNLFCVKCHDYGTKNISVGTNLQNSEEINFSLLGNWFRMQDKLNRIRNILIENRKPSVKNESISDTYIDLINYGIISLIVSNDKWNK